MKCPIRSVGTHEPDEICGIQSFDCLQGECALWHTYLDSNGTTHAACAIIHIADKIECEVTHDNRN
jgi:hypothetical protein